MADERNLVQAEVGKPHQEGKVRKDLGIVCSKLGQQDKATEQFKQDKSDILPGADRW